MNDLSKAIKFSTVHHFADETNLVLSDKSLKKVNKHINYDLKLLNTWQTKFPLMQVKQKLFYLDQNLRQI